MNDSSTTRPVLNGRYELHRRVARGGMADVFLARDQLLDRPVAVKVLFPQFAADPSFVKRFRREAQAAANLNHPNIVAVYDWGEHENTYFIIMEYVEGRSLAEIIEAQGPLDSDRAAGIGSDVSSALGFAHRNGTIHRDVKPGNILITDSGQVKVTDFGIARAFGDSEEDLTQSGSVMGTASYFSPEQAQGKTVDPRSDLYSLGVVLFEMAVGSAPFSGESPVAIAYKHVQQAPPQPRSINPEVSSALEGIIGRLLAKNPGQRYVSAEDLQADLVRFRDGKSLVGVNGGESASNGAEDLTLSSPGMPSDGEATMAIPAVPGPIANSGSAQAVIDTTRAMPASAAVRQELPHEEEYYEPPRRNGVFFAILAVMLVVLGGLVFFIYQTLGNGGGGAEEGELATVPNVIGNDQTLAESELADLGFEVEINLEERAGIPPSEVFDQDPAAQEEVDAGSVVTLSVSAASETVELDDVTGLNRDEAERLLSSKGFQIDIRLEASDSVSEDQVISMSPEANQRVNPGSRILLFVSEGPDAIQMPEVSRLPIADATDRLNQSDLFQLTIREEPSAEFDDGIVIRSDPPSGSAVAVEDQITLFVSTGPENAIVPSVVGLAEQAASQALSNNGFNPIVQEMTLAKEDASQDGLVRSQAPGPNTEASVGAEVVITVGRDKGNKNTTTTISDDENTTTTTLPEEEVEEEEGVEVEVDLGNN